MNGERSDKKEAVSNGSWNELSVIEVLDDCNIQEERLDEASDTHWEVHDSAVDESTSTNHEDCYDHGNVVHEEEYVQQNTIYIFVRNERSGNG